MEEREISNIYAIPANYTDSGKLFGGLLEVRNAVETGFLMALMGYPELMLFHMPIRLRIVMMTLTMLPVAVLAMMGIDGDSLFQYISHIIKYLVHKRILHFRRIGFRYEQFDKGKKGGKNRKQKKEKAAGKGSRKKKRGNPKATTKKTRYNNSRSRGRQKTGQKRYRKEKYAEVKAPQRGRRKVREA